MKTLRLAALLLVSVLAAFLAGIWFKHQVTRSAAPPGRRILHYVDPMNPAHTADKPGLAPCGMKMEPVYADEGGMPPPGGAPLLPGSVRVSLDKQQLIGVRVARAEKKSVQHLVRLLGRVSTDETRSYQVTAPAEGWVSAAMPLTVGSEVKKDETLATFYSPTFITAGQAFRTALEFQDRMATNGTERNTQRPGLAEFNVKQYRDSLRNLGVSDRQIQDMIRTRRYSEHIDIVSPADGFITLRSVSQGQRFEKGAELFRVVDLSRVWILADVFERDVPSMTPGLEASIRVPGGSLRRSAQLGRSLPQFDPVSRSLKLRFEAENPDLALKPDMFVDVEFAVSLPETLVLPAEAVLDSGLRKTVFVDRGGGYFEPRTVETGWRLGDLVQVVKGVMPGEPIVISGNFLLDSESRMKLAASGVYGAPAIDPVCGMGVDEPKARAAGLVFEHHGIPRFFCNATCRETFMADPEKYLGGTSAAPEPETPAAEPAIDPVCNMKVTRARATAAGRVSVHEGRSYYFCNDSCKEEFEANPKAFLSTEGRKP